MEGMLGYEPSHKVGSRCHIQVSYSRGPCVPCPAISTKAEIVELIMVMEPTRRLDVHEEMSKDASLCSLTGLIAWDGCNLPRMDVAMLLLWL
jgi:hypothetical protein